MREFFHIHLKPVVEDHLHIRITILLQKKENISYSIFQQRHNYLFDE